VVQIFEANPSQHVHGTITVLGNKSISHRALMLCGIADGLSEVTGFLAGEDWLATLRAMRALGVHIQESSATRVIIHCVGMQGLRSAKGPLGMGNAGTAMRLFTGLLSAQPFESQLIGDASLMRRPMERVAKPLREMGAGVRTRDGTPPMETTAALRTRLNPCKTADPPENRRAAVALIFQTQLQRLGLKLTARARCSWNVTNSFSPRSQD
jgi:5-enolpyruvylshikimate-3-phosphate synthase